MAGPPADVDVIFADPHLVAVSKPSGLVVHRGWGRERDVLMARVRDALGRHVWPVHRLDRGTSGVVVFGLSIEAARGLQATFEAGRIGKGYLALVRGVPPEHGIVDHPIPRDEGGERVPAVTEYLRLWVWRDRYALVLCRPRTGRLHQVRRHMKHISCPLIGDTTYGKADHNRRLRDEVGLARLALHAFELALDHPVTGERLVLRAPLPEDLAGPFRRMGLPPEVLPEGAWHG
jgi:tRNA pseudouridine65 synthase